MKIEKLIDSLIKNIGGFNIKKLVELIIKIIINNEIIKRLSQFTRNFTKIRDKIDEIKYQFKIFTQFNSFSNFFLSNL